MNEKYIVLDKHCFKNKVIISYLNIINYIWKLSNLILLKFVQMDLDSFNFNSDNWYSIFISVATLQTNMLSHVTKVYYQKLHD